VKSSKTQKASKAALPKPAIAKPGLPKLDKREAILDAMLDLVVERGFHAAPMSLVSKRAGASAGVIYHYFSSKEDIIHALYQRIHDQKAEVFLADYSPDIDPKTAFSAMWIRAYHFYRTHLKESRFLALYLNSSFCKSEDELESSDLNSDELNAARRHLVKLARPKSKGGILRDLPKPVMDELTFNLAARLALKGEVMKPATLERVTDAIWKAIAADE
jgi:AcrR family transcriptional regulator